MTYDVRVSFDLFSPCFASHSTFPHLWRLFVFLSDDCCSFVVAFAPSDFYLFFRGRRRRTFVDRTLPLSLTRSVISLWSPPHKCALIFNACHVEIIFTIVMLRVVCLFSFTFTVVTSIYSFFLF